MHYLVTTTTGPNASGSGLSLDDCVATVTLSETIARIVYVPNGPVCFECVFGSVIDTNATFQIDNTNIDNINGALIVDGILVVIDTEDVFNTLNIYTVVRCNNGSSISNQLLIIYEGKYIQLYTCSDSRYIDFTHLFLKRSQASTSHWKHYCG